MRQCVGQFIMGTPIPRFGGLAPSMTIVATRQIASAPRWIRHGSASRTLKRCQSSLLTVGEHWDGSRRRFDGRRSGAAWMFRGGIASFGTRSRPTIWVAPTGLVCFLSGLPRPVAWAFSLCAVGAAGKKRCQSSLLTVEEHWDGSRRRFDDRRSGTVKMVRGGIAAF